MIQNGSAAPSGRVIQQGAFAPEEKEKRAVVESAEKQSVRDLETVRSFVGKITNDNDFHRVADLLVQIKNGLKSWLDLMEPVRETQHTAWKTTCATIKKIADPWRQAEEIAIDEMAKWEMVRAERHRAEQEAANAQVKKEAEDQVIEQASSLVEQGRTDIAEQLLSQGAVVAPVYIPRPEKAEGLTQIKRWTAQVTDLMALVQEVAAGRQPLAYLEPNMPALNLQAKSLKGHLRIPGIQATEEISYARKSR